MLIEALLNLTAETSPALRRIGLVRDAVALWSRATRQRRAWAPHEARSRALVASVVNELPRRRTAVVLGSGLVRDVPLPLLAERFERVVLVDAVHLWPARRTSRGQRVERRVIDLTGMAAEIAGTGPADPDPLATLKADVSVDLVVSACVLSQLAHAPERRTDRALRADLVRRHLADLAGFAGRVCLVTDVSYAIVGRDGREEEPTDLLAGVELPPPDERWDWEVAPAGEIERGRATIHRVHAYRDFRQSGPHA